MSGRHGPEDPGEELHSLAAAYALDAVDDLERAAFERHLTLCEDCRQEVAGLREASVVLSDGLETEPPADLRAALLAQVASTPQEAPRPASGTSPAHRERRSAGTRWWVAGAAAAVIALGTAVVVQWPEPDPAVVAVQDVLEAPDAVRSTQTVDGTEVSVVTAPSLDRAVLVAPDLPPAPEGRDYQLWFVHEDGTAVSAGLVPREGDDVLLEGDPGRAVAVGISLEPQGGSAQPTTEPIVAVPLSG